MKEAKKRLDILLVEQGLTPTRNQALALVLEGKVLANGVIQTKPGVSLPIHAALSLIASPKYVGRGGLKLEKALQTFGVNPQNKICLDVGASTGGFTDCLLQNGAEKVYAVDVGQGQIAWKLRQDPHVIVLEKINARNLSSKEVPEPIDLAVMDVSFISVKKILPAVQSLMKPNGQIIVLIKPQFEAGRQDVKKGIVSDPKIHEKILTDFASWFETNGFHLNEITHSPVTGGDGNIEFLVNLVTRFWDGYSRSGIEVAGKNATSPATSPRSRTAGSTRMSDEQYPSQNRVVIDIGEVVAKAHKELHK